MLVVEVVGFTVVVYGGRTEIGGCVTKVAVLATEGRGVVEPIELHVTLVVEHS